jgi:predicted extracellular nuclease
VSYLVDALNERSGRPEDLRLVPKPAATGTDAIRVAMIYKPAALTLVGGACRTPTPSTTVRRWRRPSRLPTAPSSRWWSTT